MTKIPKKHTLTVRRSPLSPYKGVPPPPPWVCAYRVLYKLHSTKLGNVEYICHDSLQVFLIHIDGIGHCLQLILYVDNFVHGKVVLISPLMDNFFSLHRYVGLVHISPVVGTCVDKCEKTLLFKTTEQVKILANCYPPKLWIRGPAGSGKTFLLLEKAETVASDIIDRRVCENILVLCFNLVLCKALEANLNERLAMRFPARKDLRKDVSSVIDFKPFAELIKESADLPELPSSNQEKKMAVSMALEQLGKKTSLFYGKYDHIFVDEGQDLYEASMWPELLRQMHKSSVDEDAEQGFFWVMYDSNQYLYFAKDKQESLAAYLKKSAVLNKVFRNTENVFKQSSKYFQPPTGRESPITLGHHVTGLQIKWDASWAKERVQAIIRHVRELQSQNVQARDICILVENKEKRNAVMNALWPPDPKCQRLESQTADDLVTAKKNLVVVESVRRFKGLESKVVILYAPPFKDEPAGNRELLYTAMSRCVCYLIIITTQDGCEALKSDQGIQEILPDLERGFKGKTNPYEKGSIETQYEIGPPESNYKRPFEDDDGKDMTHRSPPKISRMEEETIFRQYAMTQKSITPRRLIVPDSDLLEPGDPKIKDRIRNGVFKLLEGPVRQNLKFVPCDSNMNQSSPDVRSVVARIEHEVYNERRKEINSNNYTRDLRNLKKAIEECNKSQTSHEKVVRACRDSS